MKKSIIKGTGKYVPPHIVTNEDLTEFMDTSDEWIRQRTGIKQRHWITEEDACGASDLGTKAAEMALEQAGWKAEDLDFIIFATLSPDYFFPGCACLIQRKLGLTSTPALDIRQQCTGFLHGLELCDAYIQSGKVQKILLVGAETQSRFLELNSQNRDTAVIFADGAGAVCIEAQEADHAAGILASVFHSDGKCLRQFAAGIDLTRQDIRDGARARLSA